MAADGLSGSTASSSCVWLRRGAALCMCNPMRAYVNESVLLVASPVRPRELVPLGRNVATSGMDDLLLGLPVGCGPAPPNCCPLRTRPMMATQGQGRPAGRREALALTAALPPRRVAGGRLRD